MRERNSRIIFTFVVILLLCRGVSAGNRHSYLIGGKAAVMGGAYGAIADDGSAAWYNPGGLAFVDNSSLELSVSAFSLNFFTVKDLIGINLPSGLNTTDFSSTNLLVVPTTFSYVGRLSAKDSAHPVVFALSVFVPEVQRYGDTLELSSQVPVPNTEIVLNLNERMSINVNTQHYYIGPSIGIRFADFLGVGVSIFGVYAVDLIDSNFYLNVPYNEIAKKDSFVNGIFKFDAVNIGIGGSLGILVRPFPRESEYAVNLGLTMKSPIFKMYSNIEVTAFSGNAMEVTSFTDGSTTISEFDADTVFPWGGVLSFAFFVRDGETGKPKFAADLDVDYTHSFQDEATEIDYRWVVNVRGGAELYVSDRVSLYGGFFTDFNPNKESMFSEFTDRKVDYYGGSFGVRWFNVYKTTETEKSDKIVFSTTLGLRYTYGTGKIYGMMLDYTKEEGFEGVVELVEKDTIMHNIAVYVGSSLEF